jgi:hypothetical protein
MTFFHLGSPQGWRGRGEQISPHRRVSTVQRIVIQKINLIGNGFDSTAGALLKAQLQNSAIRTLESKFLLSL